MKYRNIFITMAVAVLVTAGNKECSTDDEQDQEKSTAKEPAKKEEAVKSPAQKADEPVKKTMAIRNSRAEQLAAEIISKAGQELGEFVEARSAWSSLEMIGWRGKPGNRALKLTFHRKGVTDPFETYYLVPWQPLYGMPGEPKRMVLPANLLTVTRQALVFGPMGGKDADATPRAVMKKVSDLVSLAADSSANQKQVEEKLDAPVPSNLQIMKIENFPNYLSVQIALPGSGNPRDSDISPLAGNRMIRVSLIPDRGPVISRWIAPSEETDMQTGSREHPFPGYRPKSTPDTLTDYRPGIGKELDNLPGATLENLPGLIKRLEQTKKLAQKDRGEWKQGQIQLGANPREYVPSDVELIECELGTRIHKVVTEHEMDEVSRVLKNADIKRTETGFGAISIRHVDVMGSGRFFYASQPEPVRIILIRE